MKILIADKLAGSGVQALEKKGHQIVVEPQLSGDELLSAVKKIRPQALIVRSTRVTAELIDAAPELEVIVRAGAGVNTIDVGRASARGVFVSNCPGKNAAAVAELAMGGLLALDRYLPDNVHLARSGKWNKAGFSKAGGLKGRALGILGMGHIGEEVARRAAAFDMRVIAWSRSLTEERAEKLGVEFRDAPMKVVREADYVSLHLASAPDTRNLADRSFFEAMKPGAGLINTARAEIVDEDALLWAMSEKGIRAFLDVMSNEPAGKEGAFDHPLAAHPNCYLSHHIGASTQEAQDAVAVEAATIVNVYADTGRAPNCVNMEEHSPATHLLTVRHLDRVGVLAAILDFVRKAEWNVQEMENLIFGGAEAACARLRFNGKPDLDVLDQIREHPDVLAATLIAL